MSFHSRTTVYRLRNYLIQWMLSIPSEIALWIGNLNWVEAHYLYPSYQRFLDAHRSSLQPAPSPAQASCHRAIAQGLTERGLYITSLDELGIPETDRFVAAAQQLADELLFQSQLPRFAGKHTLTASAEQLIKYREIFEWGVSEIFLEVTAAYLQVPVAYDGLSFYYSVADGQVAGPRRWHRDREDWRMVKVAVYLTDVDADSGPFECVSPEVNDQLVQRSPKYHRFDDLTTQGLDLDDTSVVSCIGKAGTVIFVDTARYYHRGRPPTQHDRAAVFFSYFSQRPKNPFFCGRSPLSMKQLRSLAASFPDSLQKAILWKEVYPGLGKYIPKNRLKV